MIAAARRNASKPLTPIAHSTIHADEAGGDGENQSHAARILAKRQTVGQLARAPRRRRRRGLRPEPSWRGASSSSAAARTRRVPTITPSAPASAASASLLGRADPETERNGHLGRGLRPGDDLGEARLERVALAGRADNGDRVEEATRAARRSRPCRSGGVVGATSGTSARPWASQAREHLIALAERQVGDDQPA